MPDARPQSRREVVREGSGHTPPPICAAPAEAAPTLLQLPGNQPILRVDGLVLALGTPGFVPRLFQPLLPQFMESLSFGLEIADGRQTQLQLGRFHHLQHQVSDQLLQRPARERLAPRSSPLRSVPRQM